MKKFEINF